jgi:lipoyl(octanoyl) transferase
MSSPSTSLRTGSIETSRDISEFERSQRFLDFARNDRRGDATLCLFCSLHVYHDNSAHSAALNMAIDEALLEQASVPSIRFYQWHFPALSFGYFGKFADVASYADGRDLVRRWTGGGIVFHGEDLTYSIVIPVSDAAFGESSISIYEKIHHAFCRVLNAIGERAVVAGGVDPGRGGFAKGAAVTASGDSCFANPVRADVIVDGRKVAGAAQRRTRSGLLQQGSIQGIDLRNGLAQRLAEALSANCSERKINEEILNRALELAQRKYGADSWLRKR